ncbi:hypothetical protein EA462_03040 [Natrarchaeobius halalkaliphilus]|uniref:Uncharacterized protein n=1 Tax=Natrarchaeobius halalkaliphilus TaxID=1679091 RepID=A0A3N6MA38_9EURY|nr:hypothetical protein [Natrarchaeobius halalkaliphilus]RQG93190.1 hypothetical protein EA462_03040 [Natrarchaeobius halalkaliphilus]
MSVEQRPVDSPPTDERAKNPRYGIELEFRSTDTDSSADRVERTLAVRIERVRLLARIAALERELEECEKRRQEIITRYERVLEDQRADADRGETRTNAPDPLGRLRRIVR